MGALRRAELAENLTTVTSRVAAACLAADRDPQEVTIVAITKTWPTSDVELLAELGIRHVGENRDQEAREKAAACADLGLTWHFVGQLQRNKAASVARYADIVESVDRPSLVAALDRGAEHAGRHLGVCIQVDLDEPPGEDTTGGPGRGGASPAEVLALADQVHGCGSLELLGVMAVAPLGADPAHAFGRLAVIHEDLRAQHPGATMRSAGMSGDLEPAIAAGATHIRLGSALLGHREPLK
jgi:pyridoxal phosphate enzyme (YggS family)